MRSDRERLLDIVEAIERVVKYTARGRDAFEKDELVQTWVVHHLQIIGEASRAVSDDFKRDHPGVPWPKIVGMRNILVHHYFGIDPEAVWQVVEKDLPELRQKVTALIDEM
jgi:uncharacterized protein with HEPN domain